MKTVREELEQILPEYKTINAKVEEGTHSADDLARLDDIGKSVEGMLDRLARSKAANGNIDQASAFLGEASSTGHNQSELAATSGIVDPKGMTLGEAFSKSPAYQEFVKGFRGQDGTIRNVPVSKAADVPISGSLHQPHGKALITGLSDTSAGAFVTTTRLPIVSDLIGERRLTVRDLCTNITIQSDTFDYVTVTTKTNAAATVLEATTAATPGLNNVAVGAYTAAHGVKPESTLAFAVVSSIVETIAHLIPITRRAAADGGQIRQLVDAFMLYGLEEETEDQILNGNGTTPNLRGILQTVGINTVGSAGTDLDAIVDGISAIRNDNREPTGMVIHPNDWFSTGFLLAKDSAGNYLVGDPRASIDQMSSLWGLRVVVTPAMTENTVLIGDFRQAVVADREQAAIYVTDSHNDWFARNLLAILAEMRLGFGVLDPEAFATVTAV